MKLPSLLYTQRVDQATRQAEGEGGGGGQTWMVVDLNIIS